MTIKEIRALTGLSQVAFGREFNIPRRTVENWEGGVTTPPPYVLRMLERIVKEDYTAGKEKKMTKKEIEEIRDQVVAEGYPANGSTFECRVEAALAAEEEEQAVVCGWEPYTEDLTDD